MGHLNIIRIIDWIFGIICVLMGIGFGAAFLLGAGAAGLSGEQGSGPVALIFGSFGIVFAGIFLVLGIIQIIAGNALVNRAGWSKWFHIIIAILNILNFPIGTAYAGYCLWVLFMNEEVKNLF